MENLIYSKILKEFPGPDKDNFQADISDILLKNRIKIIVLDDDPTGIQTVHGCLLITNWDEKNLEIAFKDRSPVFYILTNSRSLITEEAEKINKSAVKNVIRINQYHHFKLIFISRSDSTLRGHFPLEPAAISDELRSNNISLNFPVFFIPCFFEAGRFTINNIHYFKEDEWLKPVSASEFAKDNVFGYKNSNLFEYIVEKSGGKTDPDKISSISIDDIRKKTVPELIEWLNTNKNIEYIVVNAMNYYDLRKIALSILSLYVKSSSSLVFRTSSSFPKAIGGIKDKPLLLKNDIITGEKGTGLFIVGSHVKKSTRQLEKLLENKSVIGFEIDVSKVLEDTENYLKKIITGISGLIKTGVSPVIYTSRKEIRFKDKKEKLNIGKQISGFLVKIVRNLPFSPAYILAKGGITSNDILKEGLGIEYARVLGQIIPGVPVIKTNNKNKYPNLPYIIFPGNVGDDGSLLKIFEKLKTI